MELTKYFKALTDDCVCVFELTINWPAELKRNFVTRDVFELDSLTILTSTDAAQHPESTI